MGKLSRLIGMAAQALDLDSGDRRRDQAAPQAAAPTGTPQWPVRGHDPYAPPAAPSAHRPTPRAGAPVSDADRAAIARYDYLMRTADPQRIEQMHREAFERLTPAQRAQIEGRMREELPPHERPASASADHLARAAGRAEAVRPGRMRGLLSRVRSGSRGLGAAGAVGGAAIGVLGAVAGGAVLSTAAGPLLDQAANLGVDFTALAEGIDLEAIAAGIDVEGFAGAAEGVVGSAGEAVSGLSETASGWGDKLGELGLPDIRDLFGR